MIGTENKQSTYHVMSGEQREDDLATGDIEGRGILTLKVDNKADDTEFSQERAVDAKKSASPRLGARYSITSEPNIVVWCSPGACRRGVRASDLHHLTPS